MLKKNPSQILTELVHKKKCNIEMIIIISMLAFSSYRRSNSVEKSMNINTW